MPKSVEKKSKKGGYKKLVLEEQPVEEDEEK